MDFEDELGGAREPSPSARTGEHTVASAADRPGVLRRAGEGAWHIFAALWFLLRRPSLWPLAALPAILAALGLVFGLLLGAFALRGAEAALFPEPGKLAPALALILTLTLWISLLTGGMLLGFGVALLVAAPLLERLSRRVETAMGAGAHPLEKGQTWEIVEGLRGRLRLLASAPGVLLISLVPFVGPVLGFLWAAHVLALQETDGPLARRAFPARARRDWHKRYRAESLGFGTAGLVLLLVPVANCLLAPVLTVGGTLLVLALEEGPPAPLGA